MKDQSDIFICRLKKDDYWAYPSPFVAHGGGFEIQFRNLTDDSIAVDLGEAPVHKQALLLGPRARDYVIVNGDAVPGLYEYKATATPAEPGPATAGKRRTSRKAKVKPVKVKGGSPPRIIVDT